AGNSATASGTVKIDKTNPTIIATLSPAVPNGANGWYTTDVLVTYTCADSGSGVASCPSPQTLNTDGNAVSYGGTVTDTAGRTASVSGSVKIDETKPSISANVPAANANGWFNA